MSWKKAWKWALLVTLGPQLIWMLLILFSGGAITPKSVVEASVNEWAKEHGYHRADDRKPNDLGDLGDNRPLRPRNTDGSWNVAPGTVAPTTAWKPGPQRKVTPNPGWKLDAKGEWQYTKPR